MRHLGTGLCSNKVDDDERDGLMDRFDQSSAEKRSLSVEVFVSVL